MTDVDLESVLNIRRRALSSIEETKRSVSSFCFTDTIYLKREQKSNSLLSIDSDILLIGDLQVLYTLFERYKSNIIVHEEYFGEPNTSVDSASNKISFTSTSGENDNDNDGPPIISTLRNLSISSLRRSNSPSRLSSSSAQQRMLSAVGRSHTLNATVCEPMTPTLEGKRYGSIKLPNTTMIEILEILLRSGLELLNVSNDYDGDSVLHQSFIFSMARQTPNKHGCLNRLTSLPIN